MSDPECKARVELGREVDAGNIEQVLASAKALAARCGCHAVTLVFKPKDGYTTVSIGCLRGRKRKVE
jgi:prepilin signal peptidase PulO-like enzyme (type II secretory pathway)